jgi:hypothetical protein
MQISFRGKLPKSLSFLLLAGALAFSGCKADSVNIPVVHGPSELAISFLMTANPDLLVADGFQTSAIGLNIRDRNGKAIPSLPVVVLLNGPGSIDRSFLVTDGNGMGSVTYTTSSGATGLVSVIARPIGLDANGEIYREVKIEVLGPG